MYIEITRDIRIEVVPTFVPEESRAEQNYFVFAYQVKITNQGQAPVQLISRHWIITDGNGVVHEVKGDGVIGQQPTLTPGKTYEYSSFCPLPTLTGSMRGSYRMKDPAQGEFDVRIPLFFLRDMSKLH